jgi:hypothetical protein
MNILQVSKVKVVVTPTLDTRLVLNWTPSSTICFTSHWLPQSAPQLPLVTFETFCWNRKHVLSNLGSLTGVYSHFSSCQRRVALTFGCAYLTSSYILSSLWTKLIFIKKFTSLNNFLEEGYFLTTLGKNDTREVLWQFHTYKVKNYVICKKLNAISKSAVNRHCGSHYWEEMV